MKMMLIGGGEIGRGSTSYETVHIDQEIVSMTEKEHPNFLFIGLASSFSDSYYDVIKKIYQNLGCNTSYLKKNNYIHNPQIVVQKINDADIIYIGGGDTIKLLEKVDEYNLKPLLLKALEKGTVLAGISAGAILLSKEGYSDSYILRGESEHYSFIDGLSFCPYSICPHYEKDSLKTEELKEELRRSIREVFGIPNCVALKIIDQKISVIKDTDDTIYQLKYDQELIENKM